MVAREMERGPDDEAAAGKGKIKPDEVAKAESEAAAAGAAKAGTASPPGPRNHCLRLAWSPRLPRRLRGTWHPGIR